MKLYRVTEILHVLAEDEGDAALAELPRLNQDCKLNNKSPSHFVTKDFEGEKNQKEKEVII